VDLFHVSDTRIEPGQALRRYVIPEHLREALALVGKVLDGDGLARVALLADDGTLGTQFRGDPNVQLVLIEAVFERVRLEAAPQLPSRLESTFLWPTVGLADRFRERYRPRGIVHRCTLAEGMPVWRDASVVAVGVDLAASFDDEIARLEGRARRYWSSDPPFDYSELLVRGTVVVAEVLS
jgi:hypothetical protein